MKKIVSLRGFLATALLGLILAFSPTVQAQPDTGGPQPGNTPSATGVPLDGGVSLLLAAGVGLGLKQLRQQRQNRSPSSRR